MGIGVSGGFALLGAVSAVRRASNLPPAEALRPETPAKFRPLLLEQLGLRGLTTPVVRMTLRNLERRPLRTLSSVIGIALAVALLAAGRYPYDAIDRMMDVQFRIAQRSDFTVAFRAPRPARAAEALRRMPDVHIVEPFRATGVRFHAGTVSHSSSIIGLTAGSQLRRLVDLDGHVHEVPPRGCVLSASLARALHVHAGDTIEVELLELGNARRPLIVAGLLEETLGQGAYMDVQALHRLLREGNTISGAYLATEAGSDARVFSALKDMKGVATAMSRAGIVRNVDEQTRDSVNLVLTIVVGSACLIAIGVVYNGARITLSERGRELASLRVLGFTKGEVSGILLGEQGATTLFALPVGALFGIGFSALLARAMVNERVHFPFVVNPASYVFAAVVVSLAAVLAGFIVRRRIDRLDLVAVLKTRE
ncbi:MAG: ABC transporter permease [bacterium]